MLEYEAIWEIFLYEAVLGFSDFRGLEEEDIFKLLLSKSNFTGILWSILPFLDCNFGFLSFKSYKAGLGILHCLISVGLNVFTDDFFWDDEFLYKLFPTGICLSGVVIVPFMEFSLKVLEILLYEVPVLVKELLSPLLWFCSILLTWFLGLFVVMFLESIDHRWLLMLLDLCLKLLLVPICLVEDQICLLDLVSSLPLLIFLHWTLAVESSLFEL